MQWSDRNFNNIDCLKYEIKRRHIKMVMQYKHLSILVPSPAEDFSIILKREKKGELIRIY